MKNVVCASLLLGLLGASAPVLAEKDGKAVHPADIKYQACQEKAVSTVDIRECIGNAAAEWDKVLNEQYKQLLKNQPAEVVEALRQSQRAWLVYRDSYQAAVVALYGQHQGTIWPVIMDDTMLQFVRDKALSLQQLNDQQKLD
jgi:uncharacterized protein YecT (DUF1311 family)